VMKFDKTGIEIYCIRSDIYPGTKKPGAQLAAIWHTPCILVKRG